MEINKKLRFMTFCDFWFILMKIWCLWYVSLERKQKHFSRLKLKIFIYLFIEIRSVTFEITKCSRKRSINMSKVLFTSFFLHDEFWNDNSIS